MTGGDNVAGRLQQTVAAGVVLALAGWVGYVSFNVANPEPYLFPRLIALVMLGLAGFAFVRALRGGNRTGTGLDLRTAINITPGLAVMIVYVFFLAEWLGFYAASALVFIVLYAAYDPSRHTVPVWARRLVITAGFMAVLYLTFALVLRVQTPRGLFI